MDVRTTEEVDKVNVHYTIRFAEVFSIYKRQGRLVNLGPSDQKIVGNSLFIKASGGKLQKTSLARSTTYDFLEFSDVEREIFEVQYVGVKTCGMLNFQRSWFFFEIVSLLQHGNLLMTFL